MSLEENKRTEEKENKNIIKEEKDIFAKGLPDWTLLPPEIVVRRKGRKW